MPPRHPPGARTGAPAVDFRLDATRLTATIRRWVEQTREEIRAYGRGEAHRRERLREAPATLIRAGLNVKGAVELVRRATAIRDDESRW